MMQAVDWQGGWILTYTGREFWPLAPRAEDVDIRDVAHALSNLCRYAGHVRRFYSVAEHCCNLADAIALPYPGDYATQLGGLLHDAAEAYLVDLPRPVKRALPDYQQADARLTSVILGAIGLARYDVQVVSIGDRRITVNEAEALMPPHPCWREHCGEPLPVRISAWKPQEAEAQYLRRFRALTDAAGLRVDPETGQALPPVPQPQTAPLLSQSSRVNKIVRRF